jgi:hypothetical protein
MADSKAALGWAAGEIIDDRRQKIFDKNEQPEKR